MKFRIEDKFVNDYLYSQSQKKKQIEKRKQKMRIRNEIENDNTNNTFPLNNNENQALNQEEKTNEILNENKFANSEMINNILDTIEDLYGNVARDVQFIDGVDCFYDDSDETIELFINKCWYRMFSTNFKK